MESRFSKRVTNPPMEHLKTQRYYSLSQTVLWLKALSFRNRPSEGRALSKYRSFLHLVSGTQRVSYLPIFGKQKGYIQRFKHMGVSLRGLARDLIEDRWSSQVAIKVSSRISLSFMATRSCCRSKLWIFWTRSDHDRGGLCLYTGSSDNW